MTAKLEIAKRRNYTKARPRASQRYFKMKRRKLPA